MLFFYSEGRTYTVPEVGTLLQRRLHCFYRDRIFDKRPRDRQTWSTQRQHGISHMLAKTLALGLCTLE